MGRFHSTIEHSTMALTAVSRSYQSMGSATDVMVGGNRRAVGATPHSRSALLHFAVAIQLCVIDWPLLSAVIDHDK